MLELRNIHPAFELYEGDTKHLVGYHEILTAKCNENFSIKAGVEFECESGNTCIVKMMV